MFIMQKATDVTANNLAAHLAFPARAGTVVRGMMISTVDGAAAVGGVSGVLGDTGDRLVFATNRALADAVVVGAQTAITENYQVPSGANAPILVLTSRSLTIPDSYPTATNANVLIATCTRAPREQRERLSGAGATLLDCGTDEVEPPLLLEALAARGLLRIDLEGGPRLLGAFAAHGLLDQLLLTTSPTLGLGAAPRITNGPDLSIPDQSLPLPDRLPYPLVPRVELGDDDGYRYVLWDRPTR